MEPVEGAPVPTVQGEVTTTRKVWKVIADNIAPEDILITADCRDIDDASFVGFRKLGFEMGDLFSFGHIGLLSSCGF